MNPKSLRKQLTTTLLISLAILGVIGNGLIYSYVKHLDLKEFDADLVHELEQLAAMTVIEPDGRVEIEIHHFDWPDFRPSPEAEFYELWSKDHQPIMKSPSLLEGSLPFHDTAVGEHTIKDLTFPDGRKGRAIWGAREVKPEDPKRTPAGYEPNNATDIVHIAFAKSREDLDRILGLELLFAVMIGGLMTICAVMIVSWLTARAFRQVTALSDSMGEIDMQTLSSRVPDDQLALELQPVAVKFNEVLARLEKGVQREKRFSADIAHELRTPLTALLSIHELAVEECEEGALGDPEAYSADALMLTQRLHTLTETLSQLNDTSMERRELTLEPTPVQPLIEGAWKECVQEANEKGIAWGKDISGGLTIATDAVIAHALVYNLLNNAVTYSPEGATIECTVAKVDQNVSIMIANPAVDLEQSDIDHLTEAFWQKDSSRTDSRHMGLGLSLVMAYARLLRAEIQFELSAKGRFKAHVSFPTRITDS